MIARVGTNIVLVLDDRRWRNYYTDVRVAAHGEILHLILVALLRDRVYHGAGTGLTDIQHFPIDGPVPLPIRVENRCETFDHRVAILVLVLGDGAAVNAAIRVPTYPVRETGAAAVRTSSGRP